MELLVPQDYTNVPIQIQVLNSDKADGKSSQWVCLHPIKVCTCSVISRGNDPGSFLLFGLWSSCYWIIVIKPKGGSC